MTRSWPPPSGAEIFSWCLYDFANSAFPTLIAMVAYAVYFTEVVAGGGPKAAALWSASISLSMVLVGLASPLIGAMADAGASKKRWLLLFTVISVAATAALYTVGPGEIAAGMGLFVVANLAWAAGNGVYNAFLPEITTEKNVGRVSGYGFALGYSGGLIALLVCLPLLSGGFGPESRDRFAASFVVAAGFFGLFSIPIFMNLRERAAPDKLPAGVTVTRLAWSRLAQTFHRVRSYSELFKFLAAFLIYNDGIETVIYFATIYSVNVLGFSMTEAVWLFMAVQVTALAGSLAFGHVSDRIGHKPAIVMTLALWCGVVAAAYLVQGRSAFWGIALVAGIGLGSNQVASRALMRLFVPEGRQAEFFGFFAVCGKFSALLGPLVYGLVVAATDSHRPAILSVLAFFAAGLVILMSVDVAKGRRAALAEALPPGPREPDTAPRA